MDIASMLGGIPRGRGEAGGSRTQASIGEGVQNALLLSALLPCDIAYNSATLRDAVKHAGAVRPEVRALMVGRRRKDIEGNPKRY